MGHRDLDVVALEVDDRIEGLAGQVLLEEVPQAVLRLERLAVEGQREAPVEERVVPEHVLDEFWPEMAVSRRSAGVGHELYRRSRSARVVFADAVVLLSLPRANS